MEPSSTSTLRAGGVEYLNMVTSLLERARKKDPDGGVWEAADLQWWWRRDQHEDPARQIFWLDAEGPVAAVVLMDWGDRIGCELISADPVLSTAKSLWPAAEDLVRSIRGRRFELSIREDDPELSDVATKAGFVRTDEVYVTTWMSPVDLEQPGPLPAGFELVARSECPSEPHHMIARNGPHVASFLAECSLYRSDLDLLVRSPQGDVAAYCLFWPDLETGVGLVEPMRTEDAFQRMGLARHLLLTGLGRLAEYGCTRFKVTYELANEGSKGLYLGAGFREAFRDRVYSFTT
jgi:GNAT superfamily N-acetyltransferase